MPFVPHTEQDIAEMLTTIGVDSMESLFSEIPASLRNAPLDSIPEGLNEMALARLMRERAQLDANLTCYIGAGAYEHHIPAAVWDITTRGEFMTAYTPYQAEASQGSLQLLFEYQTMMSSLMALEVSNASLYEGASALAEAILMAVRLTGKQHKNQILIPRSLHPHYREAVRAIVGQQQIELVEIPFLASSGQIDQAALAKALSDKTAALVIAQPNFFGVLEEVNVLADWAVENKVLSIGVVNPTAMALLKPPGEWGQQGVDIACGEGQPLGIPLASGGPYYGFLCAKKAHVRQMPGRIVGRTLDRDGKIGFVLTLQAREQHIRRAKATSNICTNQGLMVTASTIYLSLLGPEGLRQVAALSHERTRYLKQVLTALPGVEAVFNSGFFHEVVVRLNQPAENVLKALAQKRIQAGIVLHAYYPELKNCLLLCATETKTPEDIEQFASELKVALAGQEATCRV